VASNFKLNDSFVLNFLFRITIIFLILFNCSFYSFSQNISFKRYCVGVNLGTQISGNSIGVLHELSGNFYKNNNIFSLGLCLQNRSQLLNGGRISYSRILTGFDNHVIAKKDEDEKNVDSRFQLYFFSALQYTHNSNLSKAASQLESQSLIYNNYEKSNYSKCKLSTIDASLGFGLNTKIGKNIIWSNYIWLSTYYHTNYINGMYIDRAALALTVGSKIGLKFYKN